MTSINDYLKNEFNTQREQWENHLKKELKLEDVSTKTSKKVEGGGTWPTLSLARVEDCSLPVKESWKKAAQTYALMPENIEHCFKDDLAQGVKSFYFHSEFLNNNHRSLIEKLLVPEKDVEVFLQTKTGVTTFQGAPIASGIEVDLLGGNNIQELALMTLNLIASLKDEPVVRIAVTLDTHFFKNIAKIRAAKLLTLKVLEESEVKASVHTVALTSFKEWTLFERYSNMLRNDVSVASAYMGGADSVQSSGYQILFDLETKTADAEHAERSSRMARNTSHILALESMLGVVQDPAHGSYHLENLTQHYASSAWEMMRTKSKVEILSEAQNSGDAQLLQMKTRKIVLAGINDYADVKEVLHLKSVPHGFRLARDFEDLRLKMSGLTKKPSVQIVLHGDYSNLSARVNFAKNYFEILGLKVNESNFKDHKSADIIIACSTDEGYADVEADFKNLKAPFRYIAGKTQMDGFTSIFAGQDVYTILQEFVTKWGAQ
jgi:hypothetical protein